jgi:nucleosome-remodeling factor subunit BPTF
MVVETKISFKLPLVYLHVFLRRFYVGCDLCKNWFHGRCVGISCEDANAMNEFVCNECVQKQKTVEEEELYCICRQPYDEAK